MAVIVPIILCQDGDPLGSPKALFRLQFIAFYGLSAYATDPIRSKLTQTGEANGMKKETAEIVSAYVGHNTVPADQLPALISSVSEALSMLGQAPVVEEPLAPAVSVRRSVGADAITCLDCGWAGKMIKRHLSSAHDMTPVQYRDRWKLPADYPLVAPNYASQRSELAKKIGLGTRKESRPRKRLK